MTTSKHAQLLDKIKPLLAAIQLPPGATRLQINDCADHSYSILLSLDMAQRPFSLYNHRNQNKPYTWRVNGEASHPDIKVKWKLNSIAVVVKNSLKAIPGVRVLRHYSPKPILGYDTTEARQRKEGYDRAYIEFDIEYYPQDLG